MTTVFEDMMTGLNEVDEFMSGESAGYKASVPTEVDVKALRKKLNMTKTRFSDTFGFSLDAVKHWEGGRRTPECSARVLMTVIATNPLAVIAALHPSKAVAVATRGSGNLKHKNRTGKTQPTVTEARAARRSRT